MKRIITLDEISRYGYPYLEGGFQKEMFEIAAIEVQGTSIRAQVRMKEFFFYEAESKFHLGGPAALCIVAQVGIIHTRAEAGFQKKESPVWMKEFQMTCSKLITQQPFEVNLEKLSSEETERKLRIVAYQFGIARHSFTGKITLAFAN